MFSIAREVDLASIPPMVGIFFVKPRAARNPSTSIIGIPAETPGCASKAAPATPVILFFVVTSPTACSTIFTFLCWIVGTLYTVVYLEICLSNQPLDNFLNVSGPNCLTISSCALRLVWITSLSIIKSNISSICISPGDFGAPGWKNLESTLVSISLPTLVVPAPS